MIILKDIEQHLSEIRSGGGGGLIASPTTSNCSPQTKGISETTLIAWYLIRGATDRGFLSLL